ncbi:N-6 DNA methylase [Corynebacterium sp. HMSC11E11]|uniref:N-6 DNA methylase n=1 Tax=Corynebacterium sp. HMSC11E11 TaxID=1581089 RepID=UPI000A62C43B|nr:N-6 DNA methylase [Corynebacterium sp. HMSC11E11]
MNVDTFPQRTPEDGIVPRLLSSLSTGVGRTEADIQSDIKALLVAADLGLEDDNVVLEEQIGDGTRRRIDIATGRTIIETKKDFAKTDLSSAKEQLAGYIRTREENTGTEFIGILTDGRDWKLYDLQDDALAEVSAYRLTTGAADQDRFLVWLESAMSTKERIAPTPEEIELRLGAKSSAHLIDLARLKDLFHSAPVKSEVDVKRALWAKLLRTSFGSGFDDDESLFLNHTLLVIQAEIIAHAALGFDVSPTGPLQAKTLTTGSAFEDASIFGVVEADFFDWVLDVPGGEAFVVELGRRLSRFVWEDVENDVLKILYESVIPVEERESLGEYYTPDWLANRVVADTVADPLTARVADPSCGSGTFLFHAVRTYLDAAEAAGFSAGQAATDVCGHVVGMDVHPVSVTLARVTYLLAIGKDRLNHADRGELNIPVYLGDSIQWEQPTDLLSGDGVVSVSTGGDHFGPDAGGTLFADDLRFPASVLEDAAKFGRLVSAMSDAALDVERYKHRERTQREFKRSNKMLLAPILKMFDITEGSADAEVLAVTLAVMRGLVDDGRDHIWGYYVRNLIRPLWLSLPENQVTHLVGNPPWLRYSKMTPSMQKDYRRMAQSRHILSKGASVTAMDLSTLFVVRATELYLRPGGSAAFVMPHGTMTRLPHSQFRTGRWGGDAAIAARFLPSWDLQGADTGFPMASCVIRFTRGGQDDSAVAMPTKTVAWTVRLRRADVPWLVARAHATTDVSSVVPRTTGGTGQSPYKKVFKNGATIYPRMLMFVEKQDASASPLGTGRGRVSVKSRRNNLEKKPWKSLPSVSGVVGIDYLFPTHLGETTLPFKLWEALTTVLPADKQGVIEESDLLASPEVSKWWSEVSLVWSRNKQASTKLSLWENINYSNKLASQFPIRPIRVVYSSSGTTLTAAILEDREAVVEHALYWAPVGSRAEGQYLTAILNSDALMERVKPFQTVGLFGPRHFDKHIFDVPIPMFDEANPIHQRLAELGLEAEELAATVDTGALKFQGARKRIRTALDGAGISAKINSAVLELIPVEAVEDAIDTAE